jgi:hypothetical protein
VVSVGQFSVTSGSSEGEQAVAGGLGKRVVSINDLKSMGEASLKEAAQSTVSRMGMMAAFKSWEALDANFDFIRERFISRAQDGESDPINVLNLAIHSEHPEEDDVSFLCASCLVC